MKQPYSFSREIYLTPYTFMALALSAPTIAEATAITILRILSQIDFFIFFD